MRSGLYIIVIILLFSGCSQRTTSNEKGLTLFSAASLTDVISEIASNFEKEYNVEVKINFASSGTLARQIEHGANPDIFISANKEWMDFLKNANLIISESEKNIAGNSMVLIAPLNSPLDSFPFSAQINLPEMFKGRLSIGDPKYVPAGTYAVQILENLGCKNELELRFLPAKDVRSALMFVELGEVEAGIVYKTDALKSKKVKIITEFPDSLHEPVNYYIALINGQSNKMSTNLYNYIMSEKAAPVWKKYGFKF